jgi:membrane protease YdiL (CAAX protease family)
MTDERLPRPTYWPAILALSICFALWGVLTSVWLTVVGVAGVVLAGARWLAELHHEQGE